MGLHKRIRVRRDDCDRSFDPGLANDGEQVHLSDLVIADAIRDLAEETFCGLVHRRKFARCSAPDNHRLARICSAGR